MNSFAKSRVLALLTGAAVIFGSLTLSAPAFAEDDPSSTSIPSPEVTPDPQESTPAPEPSDTPAPTPSATETPAPAATETATPEFVDYAGRVTRLSEDDSKDALESPIQLFTVPGFGYLRIDVSQVDLGTARFDKVTLRFAVPAGLALSSDPDEAFRQLSQASTTTAPLVATERIVTPSRQRNSVGTDSLINKTPATAATHKIYAVLVTPAGGPSSVSANQTAAKVQTSVTHADSYWATQSANLVHFNLVGTVPWYKSTNSCTTTAGSTALWNEAYDKAALQFGLEGAMNEHLVLFFPSGTNCGGGIGLGTIGFSVNSGGASWVVGTDAAIEQATLTHELGHNLSLGHASWLDCTGSDPHPGFLGTTGCSYEPYGDDTDVMGYGNDGTDGGALSSPSAIRSGMWPTSAYYVAPLGTTSYTLNSVSSHAGHRAVVVEDVDGVNYFVEFRDFTNEDAQYSGFGCDAAACVAPAPSVRVLRMEQQTANNGIYDYLPKGYPGDDSLLVGRNTGSDLVGYTVGGGSFNSQLPGASGITVSVTSISGSTATVSVTKRSNALNGSYVTVVPTLTKDGTMRVGDTLTAFLEADWTADTFAFQWYRVNYSGTATAIPGATGQNYVLANGDQNNFIRATVTGSVGAAWASATDPDPYFLGYGPVSGGVLDAGTVAIDASLPAFHAVLTGWTTPSTTFAYTWKRDGSNIAGATTANYTPTTADRGHLLSVHVHATKSGYTSEDADSTAADYTLYATGTPAVSGTSKVGQTVGLNSLSYTTVGAVPASPTLGYQWYRSGVAIAGATGQSYALASADYNVPVTVKLTASLAGTIPYVVTVPLSPNAIKGTIAISGANPVVTVDPTSLTPSATSVKLNAAYPAGALTEAGVTQTYVWKRGAVPVAIAGATAASYTLTAADYGQPISVTIAVSKSNYDSIAARSSVATNYSIVATGAVDVSGALKVGSYLYPGYIDYTVAGTPVAPNLSYQWYRAGVAIAAPSGTLENYLLTASDYGQAISVRVTASMPGFQSVAKTSAGTAAIAKGDIQGALTAPEVTKNSATLLTTTPPSGITETGVSYTRQWFRGAAAIAGATGLTYQLVAADTGQTVSVKWTVAKLNYTSVVLASTPVNYTVQASTLPLISGTLAVGQALTTTIPPFVTVDGPVASPTVSYQWLRNGAAIAGATASSYTLLAADYNTAISVRLTAAATGYLTGTTTSAATTAIAKGVIAGDYGLPLIGATAAGASAKLTTTPAAESFTESGTTTAYQWIRGAYAIPGATASSYTLVAADYGSMMSVRVTVSKLNYTSVVRTSLSAYYSVLTSGYPSITGTRAVGNALTAVPPGYSIGFGAMDGTPVFQWYRNGVAIALATASSYALVAADYNTTITVKVTSAVPNFQQIATTATAGGLIAKGVIAGTLLVPEVVTNPGTSTLASSLPVGSVTESPVTTGIQWYRGAAAIAGATSANYTLAAADWGQLISVKYTLTKTNYTTVVLPSPGVNYSIVPSNPVPVITGYTAQTFNMLIAPRSYAVGALDVTGDVTLSYVWYRSGVAIAGAIGSTYTLGNLDLGKTITVRATASLTGYVPSVSTSAATQVVGALPLGGYAELLDTLTVSPTVKLTVNGTGVTTPGVTNAYQWFRGTTAIAGATMASYQATAADRGQNVWVRVTISKSGYATIVKTSPPQDYSLVAIGVPVPAGNFSVAGAASGGPLLSYTAGGSPAFPTPTYQWLRNGVAIAGATSYVYYPVSADYNTALALRVTGHVDQYLDVVTTSAGTVVAKGFMQGTYDPPTVTQDPLSSLTPMKLTSVPAVGGITESGAVKATQWFRGTTAIAGATGTTYTLTAADYNQLISVKLTYTKSNFNTPVLQSTGMNYSVYPGAQPTINPVFQVGDQMVATEPTFSTTAGPATPTFSYTWYRSGVAIAGATSSSYSLVAADYTKVITVRVTGSLPGYLSGSSTSAPSVAIQKGVIQGSPALIVTRGATPLLTASLVPGSVTETGYAVTRQWYRAGVAIAGATAATYSLTAADYGKAIKAVWTLTKLNYTNAVVSSTQYDYSVQPSQATPSFSGSLAAGQLLSVIPRSYYADGGDVTGIMVLTYQWYRTGVAIPAASGGTGETYVLAPADLGKTITVKVTANMPPGDYYLPSISTSPATQPIGTNEMANPYAAMIVSKNPITMQLSVTDTGITLPATPTKSYQWYRGTTAIAAPAGTAAVYQIVPADTGQNIWVKVTFSQATYTNVVKTSEPKNYSLTATQVPLIFGTLQTGQSLYVLGTSYSEVDDGAVPPDSVDYQWFRAGVAIPGATNSNYDLVGADYNKALTVKITGYKTGYIPASRTSAPTTPVALGTMTGSYLVPTVNVQNASLKQLVALTPGGSVEPGSTIAFQWLRGAAAIAGATTANYTLTAADYGQNISVRQTATKLGYTSVVLTSLPVNFSIAAAGTPTITGTAQVGATLTSVDPVYTTTTGVSPSSIDHQWLRNGVAIAGATGDTYTLVAADYNTKLSYKVTPVHVGYLVVALTSPQTATVVKGVIAGDLSIPTIAHPSGSLVLSIALPGSSVTEPGIAKTYQWFRGAALIAGQTGISYTLTAADYGFSVSAKVTATKANYTTVVLSSIGTDYSITTSGLPDMTGQARVGDTFTAWTPAYYLLGSPTLPDFSYVWLRNGAPIASATNVDYVLTAADYGKTITLKVTASLPGYLGVTKTSFGSPSIYRGAIAGSHAAPVVVEAPDDLLTATLPVGSITEPGVAYSYQWFRDSVAIPLATGSTYALTAADHNHQLNVHVTVTKLNYSPYPLISDLVTVYFGS